MGSRMRREMIQVRKRVVPVLMIFLLFVVGGCGSYGKLRLQQGSGETMTIRQLEENWRNYHILATGVEPNVPSAILFDRKDDGREIRGERWWELTDAKSVSDTIALITGQVTGGGLFPRLWKMLGPDDHLYGYMFTSWDHAVMSIGDDGNMYVQDIPEPPFLAVGGGRMREGD